MPLSPPTTADLHATFPCRRVWPSRVLLEAEQPVAFVVESTLGPLLAYVADEQPAATWYVMAPVSAKGIADLEAGRTSLRDALTHSWMWLVRTDGFRCVDGVWAITETDIAAPHLPRPGVGLLRVRPPEHPVRFTARIAEVDCDGLTFLLRDVEGGPSTPGSFAEELLDDVARLFATGQRVQLAGTMTSTGQLHVTAIAVATA